ncbi:hypothetical protein [Roseateles sp. BYS87W]|uniref:Uncharacterized protein n=1 Tax=Pelomonas baiyunensis TaxID=3299026 RepID=A0ABW7GWP0_9BURK
MHAVDDLRAFDGLRQGVVFCAWTGMNPMSGQRVQALLSIQVQIGCPVMLLTPATIADWQHPEHPFHPAFPFLSSVHQADYLRVYLMHHYGGGYTDIKHTSRAWAPFFARLRANPGHDLLGYTEIGPQGVAPVPPPIGDLLRANYQHLVGLCAFVGRRYSPFTTAWMAQTHALLDAKLAALQASPAQHPQDQTGVQLPDGRISTYPLAWTELLGNVFHPLVLALRDRVLHDEIAPSFTHYR